MIHHVCLDDLLHLYELPLYYALKYLRLGLLVLLNTDNKFRKQINFIGKLLCCLQL